MRAPVGAAAIWSIGIQIESKLCIIDKEELRWVRSFRQIEQRVCALPAFRFSLSTRVSGPIGFR